jgi:hypothetical protein
VVRPEVDPAALDRLRAAPERRRHWLDRLVEVEAAAMGQDRSP